MRILGRATFTGHVTERALDSAKHGAVHLLGVRVRLTEAAPGLRRGDVVIVDVQRDEYMQWAGRIREVLCALPSDCAERAFAPQQEAVPGAPPSQGQRRD